MAICQTRCALWLEQFSMNLVWRRLGYAKPHAALACLRQRSIGTSQARTTSLLQSRRKGSRNSRLISEAAAANGPDPLIGLGLAYIEFALQKRGLFGLMFGPILKERAKHPVLNEAVAAALEVVERIAGRSVERPDASKVATMAALGLVHGLSSLFVNNLFPESLGKDWAQRILLSTGP